jgi:polyferredoxin
MVSQALLVGWTQAGVPWRFAPGLVLLVATALLVPVATRRQVYCHHLCPHGAAQQLLKNRVPYQLHLPARATRLLATLPAWLLVWVLLVALCHLPFNLAALEPFDAYLFRLAGWSTIAVAVAGLAASLVLPMAYCRFGCPTGAVLNFLRLQGPGDRFGRRDALALVVLALAIVVRCTF